MLHLSRCIRDDNDDVDVVVAIQVITLADFVAQTQKSDISAVSPAFGGVYRPGSDGETACTADSGAPVKWLHIDHHQFSSIQGRFFFFFKH